MITGDLPITEAIETALDILEDDALHAIIAGPAGFAVRDGEGLCIFTENRLIFAARVAEVRFDD